tara:strand:- start:170 stop:319 length:150 start_codon:yes stop_codon:yes gene_type:complete
MWPNDFVLFLAFMADEKTVSTVVVGVSYSPSLDSFFGRKRKLLYFTARL